MEINHYELKYGEFGETTGVQINLRGFDILRFNNISKGTAFTIEEMEKFILAGMIMPTNLHVIVFPKTLTILKAINFIALLIRILTIQCL